MKLRNKFGNEREKILVLHYHRVEYLVILHQSKRAVLFFLIKNTRAAIDNLNK